jgi:hypothetical protein
VGVVGRVIEEMCYESHDHDHMSARQPILLATKVPTEAGEISECAV